MDSHRAFRRSIATGTIVVTAIVLAGCGANDDTSFVNRSAPRPVLTAFASCDAALAELKKTASAAVGPNGFPASATTGMSATDLARDLGGENGTIEERDSAAPTAAPDAVPNEEKSAGLDHSTTNTHEAGVDEPDIVKNDGRRIYVLTDNVLRVVDVSDQRVTGSLTLVDGPATRSSSFLASQLLLHDNRLLVVLNGTTLSTVTPDMPSDGGAPSIAPPADDRIAPPVQETAKVVLVDVAAEPRVVSSITIEGSYVDARQVGETVRLVTRSGPQLAWAELAKDEQESIERNRNTIEKSTIDDWLPSYTVDDGQRANSARISCDNVVHPKEYTGGSMLSIFTLGFGDAMQRGEPVTVAADGGTVYASEQTLYVANQNVGLLRPTRGDVIAPETIRTEIHAFDIRGTDPPKHSSSGSVPGTLLNQYSMSEHDGRLRVATTHLDGSVTCCSTDPATSSSVYVLRPAGNALELEGSVDGLGKGEQIYSVRFLGSVGYVVTFRQVDPLYVVDLSNPSAPRVTGELKITGYSAYLHPAGKNRLLGVGQEASEQGRTLGMQISLFDVADPENPSRPAQYVLRNGRSDVEFDPHAFLYWPKTGLLVVPFTIQGPLASGEAANGAAVLQVADGAITELGTVTHPQPTSGYGSGIQRSVVIGDTLWTVSSVGVLGSDIRSAGQQAWIAF